MEWTGCVSRVNYLLCCRKEKVAGLSVNTCHLHDDQSRNGQSIKFVQGDFALIADHTAVRA